MAVDKAKESARLRRHRMHKRGYHDECLPERECHAAQEPAPVLSLAEHLAALPPVSAAETLDVELRRTVARLDALALALERRPTDVDLLRETRGQQRTLTHLLETVGYSATGPVRPTTENPLQALRRRRAERLAGSTGA